MATSEHGDFLDDDQSEDNPTSTVASGPGQRQTNDQARPRFTADLVERRLMRGRLPGSPYVRSVRPFAREFRRRAPGYLVATERVLAPTGTVGRALDLLRQTL